MKYDVIVVGAGLSGLVATAEMAEAGKRVLLLDQEPKARWAGRHGGLLAGYSLLIRRNNEDWASRIPVNWRGRTGREPLVSIGKLTRIDGDDHGLRLMLTLRLARSGHGFIR